MLPNDEQLNAAIEANLHLLDEKARKALTFTRWKDGIDCDYLTVECRGFVAGILLHLAAAAGTKVTEADIDAEIRRSGCLRTDENRAVVRAQLERARTLAGNGADNASPMSDEKTPELAVQAARAGGAR